MCKTTVAPVFFSRCISQRGKVTWVMVLTSHLKQTLTNYFHRSNCKNYKAEFSAVSPAKLANFHVIQMNYSRMKFEPRSLISIVYSSSHESFGFGSFLRIIKLTYLMYQCPQILCPIVVYNFRYFINQEKRAVVKRRIEES